MVPGALTLAVDGSLRESPLVLLVGPGGVLLETQGEGPESGGLVASVRSALERHRQRLAAVVAVRGPGSYIGVRSGLAAALGAAQALSLPMSLIGSLELVVAGADPVPGLTLALADAGRGGSYGQLLEADPAPGPARWRPAGASLHLGRDQDWPGDWAGAQHLVGSPGVGRQLPRGPASLVPVRDRPQALAWIVGRGPVPDTGYDLVSADYPAATGAR